MTTNFKLKEFFKDEKTMNEVDEEILKNLQKVAEVLQKARDKFKKPILITSGYRTEEHNKKVGGVKNSKHLIGKAADFTAKNKNDNKKLNKILEKLKYEENSDIAELITYRTIGRILYFHLSVK